MQEESREEMEFGLHLFLYPRPDNDGINGPIFHLIAFQMQGEKPVSVTDAWDYARSIGAKYVESSSRTKVYIPCFRN